REILLQIVAQERWIIDGTGKASFDIRLPSADVIVWLDLPRWQCLLSVYRRVLRYRGRVRPELADGCQEKWPDREFLTYIWSFNSIYLPGIVAEIAKSGPNVPIVWLTSRRQVNKLIDKLPHNELLTPYAKV
ncbi:MAG: AAA family ATPase, partial [Pseudomonadota bacterium]